MSFAKASSWFRGLGLRFQLVLFFVGVFGGVLSLFSAGLYNYISETHKREFDAALYNYVVDVSHSLDPEWLKGLKPAEDFLAASEMILPFSLGETLLQVTDQNGKAMLRSRNLGSRNLPLSALDAEKLHSEKALFSDVQVPLNNDPQARIGRYRMVSHLARRPDVGTFVVQSAVPTILLDRQQEGVLTFFSVTVPIILLVAAAFGLAFSRRAMAPVSAITAKATEIEAHHLSERIPVPAWRDEIHDLAVTLNGLLDRLERAFRGQEAFIADASHQLKTPLSILKGELEIFQRGERSATETDAFLHSAKQEIDSLAELVEDLLTLARMDNETLPSVSASLRLDEKVVECVARLERAAQAKGVRFSVNLDANNPGEAFEMNGEPELLRSLIDNLLDNAVKYSPSGGQIFVSLVDEGSSLILRIQDQGPGIPDASLPLVFKRFYRAESTRDRIPGSGLGLSIVKRIAELHGGDVTASNLPPQGALLVATFPKSR